MGYFGGGGVVVSGDNTWTGEQTFRDDKFAVTDQTDTSKVLEFQVSGVSAATTRTVTIPNANTTIPVASQTLTFSGPTVARTYTLRDASDTIISNGQDYSATGNLDFSGAATNQLLIPNIVEGTGGTYGFRYSTAQTPDAPVMETGTAANLWIFAERADSNFDFAHAQQTNPTLFVHSANQSTTQWLGLAHNATDGVISTGTGALSLVGVPGGVKLDRTLTAAGTTGAQQIDKIAGTVNFAGAATTLVVTNNLVTVDSIIYATVMTNDTTAIIKNVIPAAGSFTIRLNAAATAETRVGFLVTN